MSDRFLHRILIAILCLGTLLRVINLFWGAPFFFHPDERNIASAIAGLQFPTQLNPHFFAYGSLPIYITFFLGLCKNLFFPSAQTNGGRVLFEDAIIILRLFSTLLSIGTILLVYKIGEIVGDKRTGIIASFLCSTGIGMIQYSHFGTFEMWLTFFSTLLFLSVLLHIKKPTRTTILLLGLSLGVLISVKISSIIYLPLLLLLFFQKHLSLSKKILWTLSILAIAAFCYLLTNPFTFLDFSSFLNSIAYESDVALGKLPVFYTGEFLSSSPIIFPLIKIYPFLLNPVLSIIFPSSLFIIFYSLAKKVSLSIIYLLIFLSITFFSQTFLFAQWTRYFVPTLPLIYLCLALSFVHILKEYPSYKKALKILGLLIIASCLLFSFSFVKTVYLSEDTRVSAAKFAENTIPSNAPILSEVYDLGITPFNQNFSDITLFNFYDTDNNSPDYNLSTYKDQVRKFDYLILPSQRLYKTRLEDPSHFPKGNIIYKEIAQSSMFEKIYETPCDAWCKITYVSNPTFTYEQTTNIFDRPTVMIFKIHHEK